MSDEMDKRRLVNERLAMSLDQRWREVPLAGDLMPYLPPTVDLVEAARAFGYGRETAHALARVDAFPIPVRKRGRNYVVNLAHLLWRLGQPGGVEPVEDWPGRAA